MKATFHLSADDEEFFNKLIRERFATNHNLLVERLVRIGLEKLRGDDDEGIPVEDV